MPQIFGPIKLKRGMARDDGMIFWHYYFRNGEPKQMWLCADRYVKYQKKCDELAAAREIKRRSNRPEGYVPREKIVDQKEYKRRKSREWRFRNKSKCREMKQSWRNRNREKVRKGNSNYWKNNPDKNLARRNRRRAREAGSANIESCNLILGIYAIRKRISNCMGIKWHVDHISPLNSGGAHARSNMQLLPEKWNARKGPKENFKLPDCYISNIK